MKNLRVCHFTTGHDAHDARIFQKQCLTLAASGYDVHLIVPMGTSEVINSVSIRSAGAKNYGGAVLIESHDDFRHPKTTFSPQCACGRTIEALKNINYPQI